MRTSGLALKVLGVAAAMMVVAACETTPADTSTSASSGRSSTTRTSAPVIRPAPAPAPASPKKALETSPPPPPPAPPAKPSYAGGLYDGVDLNNGIGDRVLFALDSYALDPTARDWLQRQAKWLSLNPAVKVTIEGHADERGTREYNLALGERRATAAKDYLVSLGVAPARVRTVSYGKERPDLLCSAEKCWRQNRRSVTVVTKAMNY